MSRGDVRKDSADRLTPSQAAGMSCYSVAEEITPICADFLVADAVLRNQSPVAEFPANREKNTESGDFGGFSIFGSSKIISWSNDLPSQFPVQTNREIIEGCRESYVRVAMNQGIGAPHDRLAPRNVDVNRPHASERSASLDNSD
jgi:hypothetical protein